MTFRGIAVLGFVTMFAACGGELTIESEELSGADETVTLESALTGSVPIGTYLKATANVNLRSGPSTGYSVRLTVPNGATVRTVERTAPSNGFYKVSYNGVTGWCYGAYLALAPTSGLNASFPIGTYLKTTADLNMRTGPSTSYSVIRTIPNGSTVRTVERTTPSGGFYKVSYGGSVGWCSGTYLTTTSAPPPSGSYAFHRRSEWQTAAQPVSGPAMDLRALRYITLHYNGATEDLDGADNVYQDSDYVGWLRRAQSSYLASRGYSLGYNSGIAPDGDEWEIRGTTYRSAANGCSSTNIAGYAIQITLPYPTATPTAAQLEGTRKVIARIRAAARAAGNTDFLEVNGHGQVRVTCGTGGTSCPGSYLQNLINAGAF